jgi:hypothetical protein
LVGTVGVQNGSGVCGRRHFVCQSGREVGLNGSGYDIGWGRWVALTI